MRLVPYSAQHTAMFHLYHEHRCAIKAIRYLAIVFTCGMNLASTLAKFTENVWHLPVSFLCKFSFQQNVGFCFPGWWDLPASSRPFSLITRLHSWSTLKELCFLPEIEGNPWISENSNILAGGLNHPVTFFLNRHLVVPFLVRALKISVFFLFKTGCVCVCVRARPQVGEAGNLEVCAAASPGTK